MIEVEGVGEVVKIRIANRLLGRELPIAYWTWGHFSGLNLVRSYLEIEGDE